MSFVLRCPSCETSIADIPGPGSVDATCSRCRFAYRIVTGPVEVGGSREVTKIQYGTAQTGEVEREYELRLRPSAAAVQVVAFRRPMKEPPIVVAPGDLVSIARRIQGSGLGDPAAVVNHTARQTHVLARGSSLELPEPGTIAGIAAIAVFVLLITGAPGGAVALAILAALVGMAGSRAASGPVGRQRLPEGRLAELQRAESLLDRKLRLTVRRDEVAAEYTRKSSLAERLQSLRAKMESVGAETYRRRLEVVEAGLRVLDQQLETERKLLAQYARTVTLIEIEIESGTLLEGVAAEDPAEITLAMEELEALRGAHEEMEHRLAANEEVERLLRSGA